MAAKKKAKSRREIQAAFNGRDLKVNGKGVPLRSQAEEALQCYFETLNGHKPAHLYDLVMREVDGGLTLLLGVVGLVLLIGGRSD